MDAFICSAIPPGKTLLLIKVKCISVSSTEIKLIIFVSGVLVAFLTTWTLTSGQSRPPNFSPDAIPDTSFSCEDKITGGYYADLEADCQLFHVCVQVSEIEVTTSLAFAMGVILTL